MAIKGGDLIHIGNQVLIDRIQTGGPGQVNIPTEKIYELGNYQSVGTVLDIPDLSFQLDSLDASAELEALLTGKTFSTDTAGTEYDISKCLPIDVASQFKAGRTAASPFNVIGSVALPYLYLERLGYRFDLRGNGSVSATLRGDSIFYNPGSTMIQEAAGTNSANQSITLAEDAYPYNGDVNAGTRYALGVSLASGKRLQFGTDYTETATGTGTTKTVTVTVLAAVPTTDKIRVIYSTDTVASYPQNSHAAASATRPAAIRGRNVEVLIGGATVTDKWTSVQSLNVDWSVRLDRDEEFGNSNVIGQDFDVPDVNGSLEIKPRDYNELMEKLQVVTGVGAGEVIGALQRVPLPLTVLIKSPETGDVLKTIYVPDARFTVPGFSGRTQTKQTLSMSFESDSGALKVYKGEKA